MKKILAIGMKVILAITVLAFEMIESMNFFLFVFPAEQWYMSYLGFGLTSIAMLVYLYLFAYDADSKLKKVIALVMMVVGVIGGLATAGFGMQIEANARGGFTFTESDISFMILAVRLLLLAHAIALVGYFAGDLVAKAFQDDDGDGVPNAFDKTDNRQPVSQDLSRQYQSQIDALMAEVQELKNPTKAAKQ